MSDTTFRLAFFGALLCAGVIGLLFVFFAARFVRYCIARLEEFKG